MATVTLQLINLLLYPRNRQRRFQGYIIGDLKVQRCSARFFITLLYSPSTDWIWYIFRYYFFENRCKELHISYYITFYLIPFTLCHDYVASIILPRLRCLDYIPSIIFPLRCTKPSMYICSYLPPPPKQNGLDPPPSPAEID